MRIARIGRSVLVAGLLLTLTGGLMACQGPETGPKAEPPKEEGATGGVTETSGAAMTETKGAAPAGNVLRIGLAVWPDTLNPQKSSFSNELAVLGQNYEGLTALDAQLKTVPGSAEKWEYNADATVVTFTLRDNLTYSDGSPLTATDFVSAVQRTLDPTNPGDYQTSIDMIKGADAIINTSVPTDSAKLPDLKSKLGVSAPDPKTVVFQLTKPTPYFHTLATLWIMYPAKQSLIDKGGEQWYEDPANQIGNGKWQMTVYDKGKNLIEFKPNEHYWRGRVKLDGLQLKYIDDLAVALQAYKSGEIDIITPDPNDLPSIKADPVLGKEYKEYPGACTEVYEFNLTKAPFDKKEVREAFAYAFDRKTYIADALKDSSVATLTWIPPGYPGYDASETRYDFNPDKAKATLAAAGYPGGKGLPEVKISYSSNNPANQARAEYLIAMYQKNLGVTISADPVEGTTLVAMRKSVETHPQMNGGGWCADYPDPQNWLSIYWNSNTNFAKNVGYKNAEADKLMDAADVDTDETDRMKKYDEAQKMILGDSAQIIRSNSKNYFLIKSYVKGLEFTPQDSELPGQAVSLQNVTIQR